MVEVTLCADNSEGAEIGFGALNPDAVALVELLNPHAADYRRTIVRVTLMSGRELFVALAGAKLTSNHDEHHSRYREFARSLLQAKSPLAAL